MKKMVLQERQREIILGKKEKSISMGSLIINYKLPITALNFLMVVTMGSFSISPIHPTQHKHSIVTNIICIRVLFRQQM